MKDKQSNPSDYENSEEQIQELYHRENKDIVEETEKPKNIYENYKERSERLLPYEVKIGGMKLPITPSKIPIQNPTEPKKYKNVAGQEIVLGVTVLARTVSISSYFPYFTNTLESDKTSISEKTSTSPKEYCDYFEKLKNKGISVDFKIGRFGTSFKAYITQFDYELITGRDVDFTMTLTEDKEVKIDEIDI